MKLNLTKRALAFLLSLSMLGSAFAVPVWANDGSYDGNERESAIEPDFKTATIEMTEGETYNVNDYLTYTAGSYDWDVSDSSVVSVSGGVIKAKGEGYATVTAKHDYEVWAFKVGVEAKQQEVKTFSKSIEMVEGNEMDLSGYMSSSPSYYDWSSDSDYVATVNRGVVKAKQPGLAVITASSSTEEGTFYISVSENNTKTKADTTYVDIKANVGETLYLADNYLNERASLYKWSVNDTTVADMISAGVVNAKNKGTAKIYADAPENYQSYIFTLKVTDPSASTTTKNFTLYVDDSKNLSSYVDGSASRYDWSSDNTSIASVSDSGVVTAKRTGSAVIYVYESGYTKPAYEFNITVKSSSSSSSSSSKSINERYNIYMGVNDSVDIADYLSKSASSYDWETSDKSVCKFSGSKLKAVDSGSATIRAYGSKNYQFNVKVNKNYSNYAVSLKIDGTLDLDKYLDDDVSRYDISYYETGIAKVKNSVLAGNKKGYTYVIFENKRSNEIVQLMVTVSGTAVTTEKPTETTTQQKVTEAPVEKPPVSSAPSFRDISHRQWAAAAINNMAARGFINGRSSTVFAPDDQCSKADFTIVLTKMIGIENDDYAGGFDDVSSDKYYAKYVNVARYHGICAGVSGNTFKPQTAITREEVMYMVYMGLKLKGRSLDTDTSALAAYSDSDMISSEYREAVAALLNEGIVSGVSSTEIDPTATITRAQMAVLLNNIGI